MYGLDNQLDLSLSLDFETAEEVEAFLDKYITFLRDENDFEIMNPETINMDKAIAYGKEVDGSLLVFGLNYQPETTLASIAFWVV